MKRTKAPGVALALNVMGAAAAQVNDVSRERNEACAERDSALAALGRVRALIDEARGERYVPSWISPDAVERALDGAR